MAYFMHFAGNFTSLKNTYKIIFNNIARKNGAWICQDDEYINFNHKFEGKILFNKWNSSHNTLSPFKWSWHKRDLKFAIETDVLLSNFLYITDVFSGQFCRRLFSYSVYALSLTSEVVKRNPQNNFSPSIMRPQINHQGKLNNIEKVFYNFCQRTAK